MHGSFRDDVGVQAIAQVDGVDIVTAIQRLALANTDRRNSVL